MKIPRLIRRIWQFSIDNIFISILISCLAFVLLVSFYRIFVYEPKYVYAKIKVGYGLWASSNRPSIWMLTALKKGLAEKNLLGERIAEIVDMKYFPQGTSNQFEIFLIAKLKVNVNRLGKYNYNRYTIGVGSPVDFEFPQVQIVGTIMELSTKPIADRTIEKTITMYKKGVWQWEYDLIKVGDSFHNGREKVFEVTEKNFIPVTNITTDAYGNYPSQYIEPRLYTTVKAKIRVQPKSGQYYYNEELLIAPGKYVSLATTNYSFDGFIISEME